MANIETEAKLGYDDVLVRPRQSRVRSPLDVSLERTVVFGGDPEGAKRVSEIPVIASAAFDSVEQMTAVQGTGVRVVVGTRFCADELIAAPEACGLDTRALVVAACPGRDTLEELEVVVSRLGVRWILVEDRLGRRDVLLGFCNAVRHRFPNHIIVSTAIGTRDGVESLAATGTVDMVKPITNWPECGVGIPALSSTIETVREANIHGSRVVAPIHSPGEAVKALAAGADFVSVEGEPGSMQQKVEDTIRALKDACVLTDCRCIDEIAAKAVLQVCR